MQISYNNITQIECMFGLNRRAQNMEKIFEFINSLKRAVVDIVVNDCDICLSVIYIVGVEWFDDSIVVYAADGSEYTFIGNASFFEGEHGQGIRFNSGSLEMSLEPAEFT